MTASTTEQELKHAVYSILNNIPEGKVISYGTLATYAGFPGYARHVGRLLRNLPDNTGLPWHRVILSSGRIAFGSDSDNFERQKRCLEKEGVPVINGRISSCYFFDRDSDATG